MGLNDLNIYNNQFSLEYYLNTNLGNSQIINYAKDNKLNINYACFVSTILNKIHYLLTSSCRLITVEYSETDDQVIDYRQFNKDNFIMVSIYYQNICVKISQQYTNFNDLTNHIHNYDIIGPKFVNRPTLKGDIVSGQIVDLNVKHDKLTKSDDVIECTNILKLNHLFLLKNMSNLKTLVFHKEFNHYIHPNLIPQSVIKIDLGYQFNHPLDQNVLPSQLVELRLSNNYTFPLDTNTFTSCSDILEIIKISNYDYIIPIRTIQFLTNLKTLYFPQNEYRFMNKIKKDFPQINIHIYSLWSNF